MKPWQTSQARPDVHNCATKSCKSFKQLDTRLEQRWRRKRVSQKKIRQNSFSGIFASLSSEYCDVKVIKDDILNASLL